MWPFSETNAAAMRTLKTPVYAESSAQSGEEHLPAWKRETKDQHGVSTSSRLARIHASLTVSACLKIGKHSRPELQMRREACGIWPSCGEKFGAAPRPATRASHSISRSSVGTAGNRGNERLSSAIVRRPLCRAHLHTSDGVNPDETIVAGPRALGYVRRHWRLGRNGQPDRHLPVHPNVPGRHARRSHLRHAERAGREPHDGNG